MFGPVKILVVEDDAKVGRFVVRALTEDGYTVDHAKNGREALTQCKAETYDLVVLDWMLPEVDGITVCRELRASGLLSPVLMLTARGETKDRVEGLDAGADDYMPKPFEVEEFLARVRALIRRTSGFGRVVCGPLEIDRVGHRALLNGTAMNLTSREYALLLHLAQRTEKIVTRADLLTHVWELSYDPGSNLVEVHISRLREKLGEFAWMIETVRGSGYRMRSQQGE